MAAAASLPQEAENCGAKPRVAPRAFGQLCRGGGPPAALQRRREDRQGVGRQQQRGSVRWLFENGRQGDIGSGKEEEGCVIMSCFVPPPLPTADPTSSLLPSCPPLLRLVGLQGWGGNDAVDVDPKGDDNNDTTISPPCPP